MPDFDEIDRAYTRARPPPAPGMDGFKKLVTGGTKWVAIAFVALMSCFAISAAADQILGLGWRFAWRDFWAALAMCAGGMVLYAVNRAWFAFTGFDRFAGDKRAPPDESA